MRTMNHARTSRLGLGALVDAMMLGGAMCICSCAPQRGTRHLFAEYEALTESGAAREASRITALVAANCARDRKGDWSNLLASTKALSIEQGKIALDWADADSSGGGRANAFYKALPARIEALKERRTKLEEGLVVAISKDRGGSVAGK